MAKELGAFLRSRREVLHPADVGLVGGGRRRAVGLRREEVAVLASMSADYYERIEQGRGPSPSREMLGAISRALRLTIDERDYVYLLAGHEPPLAHQSLGYTDPGLMRILDALAPTVPALVTDDLQNVIAQNPLNIALIGDFSTKGPAQNFLRRWFTDTDLRRRYSAQQHDGLSREYVADLRATLARRDDQTARALVRELCEVSREFRAVWDLHEVAVRRSTHKRLHHSEVGTLDFHCDTVLSQPSGQRLVLFRSQPGTDTAERIDMLRVLGTQTFASEATVDLAIP